MTQAADDIVAGAGPRLRAHRERRGLSLNQLSAHVGVSASTLSRLESGLRRPTLELLVTLARLYETTLDDLVTDQPMGDPRVHLRAVGKGLMTILPLSKRAGGVKAFKVVLRPGEETPEQESKSHDGWQWLMVLAGRLQLRLDGHEFRLCPGEAAEFDTHAPHQFSAVGGRPVEYLVLYGAQGEQVALRVSTRGPSRRSTADTRP